MINQYTSNPEDIFLKREENLDPAVIIKKFRKSMKIKRRILDLALKEIPRQNREAQRNIVQDVIPLWALPSNSFDKDNIDPAIRFEDFLLAIS